MHLCNKTIQVIIHPRSVVRQTLNFSARLYSTNSNGNYMTADDLFEALKEKILQEDNNKLEKVKSGSGLNNNEVAAGVIDEDVNDKFFRVMVNNATADAQLQQAVPKPFLYTDVSNLTVRNKSELIKQARRELLSTPPDSHHFKWFEKWPLPRPFNPDLVPLPIRMGQPQKRCIPPDKYGNLELMKTQNFLHLTPPAIKKDCEALKKFCTPFPPELKSDEACERMFPVESHFVDYITASTSVRDHRARTVTKTFRLCNLVLDDHARRKMIQLLGKERYNSETDVATIKVERCPTRKQNSDFINYVITALYFESWAKERWEVREEMNDNDCYYWWEKSKSHENLKNVFKDKTEDEILKMSEVEPFQKAVSNIKLEPEPGMLGEHGESREKLLEDYKQSVLKLLNLSPPS